MTGGYCFGMMQTAVRYFMFSAEPGLSSIPAAGWIRTAGVFMRPVYHAGDLQIIQCTSYAGVSGTVFSRRYHMDTYDYSEESLAAIARSCRHLSYRHPAGSLNHPDSVSCIDCTHWNGNGCSRNHLDSIASELHLD